MLLPNIWVLFRSSYRRSLLSSLGFTTFVDLPSREIILSPQGIEVSYLIRPLQFHLGLGIESSILILLSPTLHILRITNRAQFSYAFYRKIPDREHPHFICTLWEHPWSGTPLLRLCTMGTSPFENIPGKHTQPRFAYYMLGNILIWEHPQWESLL